jgi:hypothetical protein
MATNYFIGNAVKIGSSTIQPTEGYPSGQVISYDKDGVRSFDSLSDPQIIGKDFGIEYVDITKSGTLEDASANIVAGGTSQVVFAAKSGRSYLFFGNTSDTTMYINFGGVATSTNSYKILAGENLKFDTGFVPLDSVNVLCATTAKTFVAKQA